MATRLARGWIVVCVAGLAASVARADAIGISTGSCPPGLRHGVVHHSDACTPIDCTTDADCGEGAACHEIVECMVEETRQTLDGRVVLAEPVRVWIAHGLCDAAHACADGRCQSRHQCEPTSASAAWDPAGQRWTGTFLDAPEPPPPSEGPPPQPSTTTAPSPPSSSSMCAVTRGPTRCSRSWIVLAFAPIAVRSARRRRTESSKNTAPSR